MPPAGFEPTSQQASSPQQQDAALNYVNIIDSGYEIVGLDASGSAMGSVADFYEQIKTSVTLKQYMAQETQILKPNTVETTNIEVQNLGLLIKFQLLNILTPGLKRALSHLITFIS
jgi:hypothetical protein